MWKDDPHGSLLHWLKHFTLHSWQTGVPDRAGILQDWLHNNVIKAQQAIDVCSSPDCFSCFRKHEIALTWWSHFMLLDRWTNSKQPKSVYSLTSRYTAEHHLWNRNISSSSNEHIFCLFDTKSNLGCLLDYFINIRQHVADRQLMEQLCQSRVVHVSMGHISRIESTDEADECQWSKYDPWGRHPDITSSILTRWRLWVISAALSPLTRMMNVSGPSMIPEAATLTSHHQSWPADVFPHRISTSTKRQRLRVSCSDPHLVHEYILVTVIKCFHKVNQYDAYWVASVFTFYYVSDAAH